MRLNNQSNISSFKAQYKERWFKWAIENLGNSQYFILLFLLFEVLMQREVLAGN